MGGVAAVEQLVDGVVVLDKQLLLNGVLLQCLHLQQRYDVLDRHNVDVLVRPQSVVDDEIIAVFVGTGDGNGQRVGGEAVVIEQERAVIAVVLIPVRRQILQLKADKFALHGIGADFFILRDIEKCDVCPQCLFQVDENLINGRLLQRQIHHLVMDVEEVVQQGQV